MLTNDEMKGAVSRLLSDLSSHQVLRRRKEGLVARINIRESCSVVAKLWDRSNLRGTIGRFTFSGSAYREWRAAKHLYESGVSVPKPLGYCKIRYPGTSFTDAVFAEDLGPCITATQWIKSLIESGNDKEIEGAENQIIELTRAILRAGVVDTDHSMVNIIIPASGRAFRLDFELARRPWVRRLMWKEEGEMIGRLVATYVFAVQPDMERARSFAHRLASATGSSAKVLSVAAQHVTRILEVQSSRKGINSRLVLGW